MVLMELCIREAKATVRSSSGSVFSLTFREVLLVYSGREEYSFQTTWSKFWGAPAVLKSLA